MIFNHDLLFLHVPKAGGMAVSGQLLKALPPPVYYSAPEGHFPASDPTIIPVASDRHENLADARNIVAQFGFDIATFSVILAVIRNPYALEVSRYAYLQQGHPWDAGPNQRLALEEDFETFAVESCDHARPIETYFELDGHIPRNLRVLRCEQLAEDLGEALREIGIESYDSLPRDNESKHGAYEDYYTRVAEEAVYQRYRWVFERGFYPRLDLEGFSFVQAPPAHGPQLPLEGPIRQVAIASGLWHDGWVGEALRFRVKPSVPLARLVIDGRLPHKFAEGVELSVAVAGHTSKHLIQTTGAFRLEASATVVPADRSIPVEVLPSTSFCPRKVGQNDDGRQLSFILERITFVAAGANSREQMS